MSAIIEGEVDADAKHVQVIRQLICDVCAQFYNAGWAVGTSGSVAIRYGDQIHTTPSGTLLSHESRVAVVIYKNVSRYV
jgi:ribulose-5-phosphate 4-epimerase/fuculose-1-phosphate aldolase